MAERRGLVAHLEWATLIIRQNEPKTFELRNRRCKLARGTPVDLIARGAGRRYGGRASFTVLGGAQFEENVVLAT
eukprot:3126405-Pyramimonas_sp.AAC.1